MAELWDKDHPLTPAMVAAVSRPFSHWEQGWPMVHCPRWPGRGLAGEVGARVYGSMQTEPGWPPSLDDLERLLDEVDG